MARTLWRYYSDVGQRLRSRQSRYLTGGNALIDRLKLSLDKRRVPLWLNTRLIELLRENGRVIGARVERNGVETAIGVRKGVILAAGGFERSHELRATYLPNSPNPDWRGSQANNTGDSLVAAQRVGAEVDSMDSAWFAPAVKVPGENRRTEERRVGKDLVSKCGSRWSA